MLPNPNPNKPLQTQVIGGQQPTSTIPNYPFAPYQIKQGDTFANIANTYGVDETTLQGANNNMLVPPPTGSYINLPVTKPATPAGYYPQPLPNYYSDKAMQAYRAGEKTVYTPPTSSTYGAGGGGQINFAQGQINEIIARTLTDPNAPLPAEVPFGTQILNPQTGQPITARDYLASGYVFNPSKNSWVLKGGGGVPVGAGGTTTSGTSNPGGTFASNVASNIEMIQKGKNDGTFQRVKADENYGAFVAQEKAFLSARRWDPARKKYVSVGRLIREGRLNNQTGKFNPRLKQNKQVQAPPEPVLGAGTTPEQQLNVNQGGG